jgi:quaternary ammonium compound-resistance protein SugE
MGATLPPLSAGAIIDINGDWRIAMAWTLLALAGLMEIGWAIGLKYTEGFSRLWPSIGTAAAMIVSMGLLGLAVKTIPIGTAYAVWTGIGAAGTVVLGIVLFHEPASALRLACVAMIVLGIVGLKIASPD